MSEKDSISPDTDTDITVSTEWMRIGDQRGGRRKAVRKIVSSIPLFQDLTRHDWHELVNLFHSRMYADNEMIFERGTPGLGMYIIIKGKVRIVGEQDGVEVDFAGMSQGDFFGELSLVDDAPRSATAVAKGETHLIGIFRPQLQQLIHNRPKFGVVLLERLASIVAQRLREANNLLEKSQKSASGGTE